MEKVLEVGFDQNYGIMAATPDGLAYPCPKGGVGDAELRFLGLMVGKALYEGILLDAPLAPFFVRWL